MFEMFKADFNVSKLFFFFQAEDGIRDDLVTGVQTCALPIYSWSGILNPPPQSFTITNSLPGGWDPVMVWRMATSTGTLKPAFALGAVGTASWTDSNTASQVADVYLISRDSAGVLQERLRVTSTGNIGIGTAVPVAQ